MKVAPWVLWAVSVAAVFAGLAAAAPARAEKADLTAFMAISEQESGEIRRLVESIFGQLGLDSRDCASSGNTVHICALVGREKELPLTSQWDSTFERLAEGWSGAALPWRTVGTPATGLGHRKALAQDRGASVLLMRVFIPRGHGLVLEVLASKHPWL